MSDGKLIKNYRLIPRATDLERDRIVRTTIEGGRGWNSNRLSFGWKQILLGVQY